jgi:hypothetical protein
VNRIADGAVFPTVENGHPEMTYKLVYAGFGDQRRSEDVRSHEEQGWQVVFYSKDGPRLGGGVGATCKPNEPIEWRGHVLMDINKLDVKRVEDAGQARMDKIEARMIDKDRGPIDPARGMRSRYFGVLNETKANERTREIAEEREEDG